MTRTQRRTTLARAQRLSLAGDHTAAAALFATCGIAYMHVTMLPAN